MLVGFVMDGKEGMGGGGNGEEGMGRRRATAFGWERTPKGRPELRKILSGDCFVVLGAESFTKSGGGKATRTTTILRYLRAVSLGLQSVRKTGRLR